jgi:hypothetical protein
VAGTAIIILPNHSTILGSGIGWRIRKRLYSVEKRRIAEE